MLLRFFLICLSSGLPSLAQATDRDSTELSQLKAAIEAQAYTLQQDSSQASRLAAAQQLDSLMKVLLKDPKTFGQAQQIEGISCQSAPDGAFQIYTWQVRWDENTYRYGGIIQNKEGKLFPLTDKSYEAKPVQLVHLNAKNWHGALYYRILDFEHDGKKMYLLFGYNVLSAIHRRKVLEVLYFDRGDQPRFGQKVIQVKDGSGRMQWVSRMVMDYAATSVANLNYSASDKMIIFDHLVDHAADETGGAAVTDGSYCGLKLVKGKWEYVDMPYPYQYDRNTSWSNPTAPIEKPLFDKNTKRDIFGKKKRNNRP
jgi:hypothetical protein